MENSFTHQNTHGKTLRSLNNLNFALLSDQPNDQDQSGEAYDPFIVQPINLKPAAPADPFAPAEPSLIDEVGSNTSFSFVMTIFFFQNYDPFAVRPVEDIVAAAKAKAEEAVDTNEEEYFGGER